MDAGPGVGPVPVHRPRRGRPDQQRVAQPGRGDPAGAVAAPPSVPPVGADLSAGLDGPGGPVDRLRAPADVLHRDRPRRDDPGRAAGGGGRTDAVPGGDRRDGVPPGGAPVPPRTRAGRPRGADRVGAGRPVSWGLDEVTVRFGSTTALSGVSLEMAPGGVTAVIGGDGAGKSTALRALAGLVPVDEGRVRRPPEERLGYLPETSGVYPDLTAAENLAFAATAHGIGGAELVRRSEVLLERTGLAAARDRLASRLSGGMRQKLGLAVALIHRPDLLVLDEPTTGIDPVSRAELWRLIADEAARGAAGGAGGGCAGGPPPEPPAGGSAASASRSGCTRTSRCRRTWRSPRRRSGR